MIADFGLRIADFACLRAVAIPDSYRDGRRRPVRQGFWKSLLLNNGQDN
jgi:hypothetical protein